MANVDTVTLDAMDSLVRYFVARRASTVVKALIDLRPDIIVTLELYQSLNIRKDDVNEKAKLVDTKIREGSYQWTGVWKTEWAYRLHGDGCELIHMNTDERFNWDLGDPYIFFTGELQLYLNWLTKAHLSNPDVKVYSEWYQKNTGNTHIDILLNGLVQREVLATRFSYEWKLLSPV